MTTLEQEPDSSEDVVRHSWSESERFVPRTFVRPLQRFMATETAGGVVILAAAVVAMVWANSPWSDSYFDLWQTHIAIEVGDLLHLDHLNLQAWVNDLLMAFFFFVVGLEIKRELVHGELRDPKAVVLPVVAALGGMVVPALVYTAFNAGEPGADGWGIPMATDIAFAVGVLSLAGPRVPSGAKIFLLTLAIADDIGAILVIAVFYTSDLSVGWLAWAFVGLAVVAVMQRVHIRSMVPYWVLAAWIWLSFLESGVHATLAGVTLGLITPAWSFYDPRRFAGAARPLVDRVAASFGDDELKVGEHQSNDAVLADVTRLTTETRSPLERLEHMLAPWSAFLIVPVFALANAGVKLDGDALGGALSDPVVLGVGLGLVVGKLVGVVGATWIATRLGLGRLPANTTWNHMVGVGLTAGIGFTVALFVTGLAFDDPAIADSAKIGILAASLLAGVVSYVWLRVVPSRPSEGAAGAAQAPASS